MKRINILLALLLVVIGCKMDQKEKESAISNAQKQEFLSFGSDISDDTAKDQYQMFGLYQNLKTEDTVQVIFQAQVKEVCQNKGCWMKLSLANGQETMVRFKDYGFFVPKDLAGSMVIVEGNAFLHTMNPEEQQHMAEDAGKKIDSTQELQDMVSYGFEASGVRILQ
ncbi:MAG: DUF4920 domain-containing protein [Flavobacteriaceae bacterium]|nr:DUF4920 domain-containing protein [Flavobacteriaceae bacterium]MDH3796954.1 DUF4920 domain-containing protein [Flavobacteriaceae bacterium]